LRGLEAIVLHGSSLSIGIDARCLGRTIHVGWGWGNGGRATSATTQGKASSGKRRLPGKCLFEFHFKHSNFHV